MALPSFDPQPDPGTGPRRRLRSVGPLRPPQRLLPAPWPAWAHRPHGGAVLVIVLLMAVTIAVVAHVPPSWTVHPSTTPTVVGPLPDGKSFALIRSIDRGGFVVDPAWLLVGDDARAAAIADGVIGPDQELPGDVYIFNQSRETISLAVAEDADLVVLAYDDRGRIAPVPVTIAELHIMYEGGYAGWATYGLQAGSHPVVLEIEAGRVVGFVQPYLAPTVLPPVTAPGLAA